MPTGRVHQVERGDQPTRQASAPWNGRSRPAGPAAAAPRAAATTTPAADVDVLEDPDLGVDPQPQLPGQARTGPAPPRAPATGAGAAAGPRRAAPSSPSTGPRPAPARPPGRAAPPPTARQPTAVSPPPRARARAGPTPERSARYAVTLRATGRRCQQGAESRQLASRSPAGTPAPARRTPRPGSAARRHGDRLGARPRRRGHVGLAVPVAGPVAVSHVSVAVTVAVPPPVRLLAGAAQVPLAARLGAVPGGPGSRSRHPAAERQRDRGQRAGGQPDDPEGGRVLYPGTSCSGSSAWKVSATVTDLPRITRPRPDVRRDVRAALALGVGRGGTVSRAAMLAPQALLRGLDVRDGDGVGRPCAAESRSGRRRQDLDDVRRAHGLRR